MPRGRKIVIETEVEDDFVDRFKSIDLEEIRDERSKKEKGVSTSVAEVFRTAQNLYKQKVPEEELEGKHRLYSVKSAYDYVKNSGLYLSFRAFGGRIERGNIPYVKIGKKRYIPRAVLDDMLNTKQDFYTVREAYEEYKKYNPKINLRAFIGRVEKGSVPSVKLGTRRLIPRDAVDALTHISSNYYSVSEAVRELHKNGIKIKRNAFERRLDRGRVPHVKVGGRRYIHEKVLDELVGKELSLRKK